jgi:hypothetical protein
MTGARHHTQLFTEMGGLKLFAGAGLELQSPDPAE